MEKLTNIRERIWYGRKMDRRFHSRPFRKVQSYNAYKSMEQGFKREHAKSKNTSRTCPTCSELNKPNGHVFRYRRCGFQEDRYLAASRLEHSRQTSHVPSIPLAAKATHEAIGAEVERIVIKC